MRSKFTQQFRVSGKFNVILECARTQVAMVALRSSRQLLLVCNAMKFAHSPCFGGIYHLHLQGKNKSSIKPAEAFSKLFLQTTQHYNREDWKLHCLYSVTCTCICHGHEAQSINSAMLIKVNLHTYTGMLNG
jgi:hypothetical protein